MTKQTIVNFTKMSKEHSNELTTIVNETLAKDLVPVKILTTADLWNIQRMGKANRNRRHLA